MFFFFIGGVSPEVRQVLEKNAAKCLRCGSDASIVQYDNVFRAFFIPLWRWPAKGTAGYCEKCGLLVPADVAGRSLPPPSATSIENEKEKSRIEAGLRCWSCSAPSQRGFKFCPQCGAVVEESMS
ncbi:hypothetical protein O6H91_21G021700 [Diphasiastrum complanatum]|uniref:Uncharacterized protein n=1 Tax=Diphasiastrum complanatum TaxID=34168 RepID=A0ACC2AKD6_DIPCM|nr:hypothetical protein O6H91_21G021700 [Diphasiastrum complanatum]